MLVSFLCIGEQRRVDEFARIVPPARAWQAVVVDPHDALPHSLPLSDWIVDLNLDDAPQRLRQYKELRKPVIGCAVKRSVCELQQICGAEQVLVGLNAFPTMLDARMLEVSFPDPASAQWFASLAKDMNWTWRQAGTARGMITPRIIAMIINEAYFSLYHGISAREDIDRAMKWGTNYPWGPFEWCDRIGIRDVFETLQALAEHDRSGRYEICPLLADAYHKQKEHHAG